MVTGSGASVIETVMSAGMLTWVFVLTVLFVVSGSISPLETVAVLMIAPVAVVVTTIVNVAEPPGAMLPRSAVTEAAPWLKLPCETVAETNWVDAGKVSTRVTPVAGSGPLLVTVTV